MEIERINENTIKFYISYEDIKNLGYEKDEIWYNRERSEQLFWHMMDEVNHKEDFNPEGPLWIQVQSLDKGLEIVVTKAKFPKHPGSDLFGANPDLGTGAMEFPDEDEMDDILDETFGKGVPTSDEASEEIVQDDKMWLIVNFNNFEEVIQLSHFMVHDYEILEETLYLYDDKYYLYVEFSSELVDEDRIQEDLISKILEFGNDSNISIHVLEEYGKIIIKDQAFATVREHFSAEK